MSRIRNRVTLSKVPEASERSVHEPNHLTAGLCSTEKRLMSLCVGCGNQIHDQYILRVSPDLEWHAACLKCAECNQYLDESCTCFVRDGKTYCKRDYVRYCGVFFLLLHKENKWKLKCWINDNMDMYLDIYCYNLDGY